MKKSILVATALVFSIQVCALEIEVQSGDSFNKVMSKNRANRDIKGSNHVVIKDNKDLEAHGKKDLGLTVDSSTVRAGTIYNYVEIKNVNVTKNRFTKGKKKSINKYNLKNKNNEARNIGVKIKTSNGFNRGFKGKVHNSVKIENSKLD